MFASVAKVINSRILARARSGVFTELEIGRGLKEELREKYFTREGPYWKIDQRLREKIHFKVHNLREIPRVEQPYDFVLLRNVLIYFDRPTKLRVTGNIRHALRRHGYMLLGAAEHVAEEIPSFGRCPRMRGLYKAD